MQIKNILTAMIHKHRESDKLYHKRGMAGLDMIGMRVIQVAENDIEFCKLR